ncbi:YgaB family protein, partial [Bacillus cereus]
KDLAGIQELFQRQTEQVIQSYRSTEKPSSYVQK